MGDMSEQMFQALKNCGLRCFLSVPCKNLAGIISYVEKDNEIIYFPVTREEEGIGIAAGAFLGGQTAVLLMQNSGLGNSINALSSLMGYYRMPMILLISQRGGPGEKIGAQVPMGRATEDLLKSIHIPFFRYQHREDLSLLNDHVSFAKVAETPVALLVSPQFWSST
ncbi:MAG: sulfopyruvate decarboxylase subunit alpha [Desulfobacterales bacterium]|jgi:sulfopyruvate decarboxylase subunit alpha